MWRLRSPKSAVSKLEAQEDVVQFQSQLEGLRTRSPWCKPQTGSKGPKIGSTIIPGQEEVDVPAQAESIFALLLPFVPFRLPTD